MASPVEKSWSSARKVWEGFKAKLAEKDTAVPDFTDLLSQYRSACENTIFQDFEYSTKQNVEVLLWEAHVKVNGRFRKALTRFRENDGKKKPVEKRKTIKSYLDFIKSSQRFYRGYIQRLSSHFGGIPEIEEVAHKFNLSMLSADSRVQVSPHLRHLILLSCHATLVRLGDLSRYRETEITTKDRNWGPAIGYYDLAGTLYPKSGTSHNQLAVIALADGNHLSATYHLYRALAVEEPHPGAQGNLEIEFRKISVAWARNELIASDPHSSNTPNKAVIAWFVRLHARCYKGEEFSEYDELEGEVLSQLAVDLKERSLGGTLQKFILINIAAESFAATRFQANPDVTNHREAFFFFLRLNVKTIFMLLQLLQPELERLVGDDVNASNGNPPSNDADKITAVARRILPGLRQYSSWLLTRSEILASLGDDNSLTVQIKELWKEYANTLNLIIWTFPEPEKLPVVEYLLEEDEDSVGFEPFNSPNTQNRYYTNGNPKPKFHDHGIERLHPNIEMLFRVRGFLTEGVELASDKNKFPKTPMMLVGARIVYQEEGVPTEQLAGTNDHYATSSNRSVEREDIPHLNGTSILEANATKLNKDEEQASINQSISASEPTSTSISMDLSMNRMVDSLVNSSTSDLNDPDNAPFAALLPSTPPEHSLENPLPPSAAVHDTTYGSMSTLTTKALVEMARTHSQHSSQPQHTPRPTLPSIWNTPFAPQSSDSSPLTRPSTARRMSPPQMQWPHSLSSASQMASTMPDPSGGHYPSSTIAARATMFGNAVGNETAYSGASVFDQNILSPWDGTPWASGRHGRVILGQTPPDGQGEA